MTKTETPSCSTHTAPANLGLSVICWEDFQWNTDWQEFPAKPCNYIPDADSLTTELLLPSISLVHLNLLQTA